jgi:hypothetical protein
MTGGKQVHLVRKGNVFQGTIVPMPGKMVVYCRWNSSDTKMYGLLGYEVD